MRKAGFLHVFFFLQVNYCPVLVMQFHYDLGIWWEVFSYFDHLFYSGTNFCTNLVLAHNSALVFSNLSTTRFWCSHHTSFEYFGAGVSNTEHVSKVLINTSSNSHACVCDHFICFTHDTRRYYSFKHWNKGEGFTLNHFPLNTLQ